MSTSKSWLRCECSPLYSVLNLIRDLDRNCLQLEQDELTPDVMRRRTDEICNQAMRKLINFKPLNTAIKALSENADALENLSERNPGQVGALQQLKNAVADLQEGIEATRRMVLERCRLRGLVSAGR